MCVQITLLTPISAAKQHILTYYMQRDGIVKSLEQLIPQAQPAFNAHPVDAQGLNNGTKSGGGRRMRRWPGLLIATFMGLGWSSTCGADGYTLSIGTSTTHMLTGGLYALPFDLLKDLEPVIQIGSEPLLIVGKK